jgi:LAS superfamily LD-carboxypeptidase LdcB
VLSFFLIDIFILGFTIMKIKANVNIPVSTTETYHSVAVSRVSTPISQPTEDRSIELPENTGTPIEIVTPTSIPTVTPIPKITQPDNEPPIFKPYGNLLLINKSNPLDRRYVPNDLVSIFDNSKFIVPAKDTEIRLKSNVMSALTQMLKSASLEGVNSFIISSGYRSYDLQSAYYTDKVAYYKATLSEKDAAKLAATIIAPPGKSEHQTGLAIDLTTEELYIKNPKLDYHFGETGQGKWIYENSWKYGFVVRYMPDKTNITGIISEPWHIRYVGLPHSEIMNKNNMCLEEYFNYIKTTGIVKYTDNAGVNYEISYITGKDATAKSISDKNTDISDITVLSESMAIVTKICK